MTPDSMDTARAILGWPFGRRISAMIASRQRRIDVLEELCEQLRPGDYGAVSLAEAVAMLEFDVHEGPLGRRGWRVR